MTHENKFNPGDVVRLKSSQTSMTINNLNNTYTIGPLHWVCLWFDQNNHLHKETFSEDALELWNDKGE